MRIDQSEALKVIFCLEQRFVMGNYIVYRQSMLSETLELQCSNVSLRCVIRGHMSTGHYEHTI